MGEIAMNSHYTITGALVGEVVSDDPRWIVVLCDWMKDVANQFHAIAQLPDGWDGDGAARPERRTLNAAWGLLTSLCRAEGITRPHVNPTRNGGLQLEWENGSRYFEIDVIEDWVAEYLYRDSESAIEETGEIFAGDTLNNIVRYIHQTAGDEAPSGRPYVTSPGSGQFEAVA